MRPQTGRPRALQAIRTVDSRQTGGPEELLLASSPIMRERGQFDPAILLLRKPNPADPERDFRTRARKRDIPVLPLPEMRWHPRWLRVLPRRMNVALVHVHGQRANYFIWLMRRLFPGTWGKLPLVATVHGWVQDNFVRKVVTRLELLTLRECDHIITVSELQQRTLLEMGFSPDKVTVVRPGMPDFAVERKATPEERHAARARWGIPQDAYVISAIGRLSTEKRFDLYLQVCAALVERLPDAVFLLVGGGKQEANLKEQAATLGLGERLIFTGLTREMPTVYAATDLVMITSDTEGIPHVLLEAMGQGIPVVSTAVGGIPEIVTSGENGLLVPAGGLDELANAATRVHDEPALACRLAAGGREVAGQFTIERLVAGTEQVYKQVLDRRDSPSTRAR
ncbi:MAG: glycosyltransferase family 4 protein [Chloroflexota bacterium]|nr:glycosyltransferase family 4 protein [Chloroflexota bacterium]